MAKQTYNINQQTSSAKDGSFGSCLCAMLVFMGICGLLLIITFSLRPKHPENQYQNDQHGQEHLHGSLRTTKSPVILTTRKSESTTKESTKEETTLNTEMRTLGNNKFEKIYESTVATTNLERITKKTPPGRTTAKAPPERITTRLPSEQTTVKAHPERTTAKAPPERITTRLPSDWTTVKAPSEIPATRQYEHTHITESETTMPNLNETTKTSFKYTTLKSISTTPTVDNVSDRIIFEEENMDKNNTTDLSIMNSTQFSKIDVRSKYEDNTTASTTYRAEATTLESVTNGNIESPSTVHSLDTNDSTTVKSLTTLENTSKTELMEETSTISINTTEEIETTVAELNDSNASTDSSRLTPEIVTSTTQNVLKELNNLTDTAISNENRKSERTIVNTSDPQESVFSTHQSQTNDTQLQTNDTQFQTNGTQQLDEVTNTSKENIVSNTESVSSTQRVSISARAQFVNTSDPQGSATSTHQSQTNDTQPQTNVTQLQTNDTQFQTNGTQQLDEDTYTSTENTVSNTESVSSTQRVSISAMAQFVNTSDPQGSATSTHQSQTNDTQPQTNDTQLQTNDTQFQTNGTQQLDEDTYTSTENTVSITESVSSTQRVSISTRTQFVNTSDLQGSVSSTHKPQTNNTQSQTNDTQLQENGTQQLDEDTDLDYMEFAGTSEDFLYLNYSKSTPIPKKENTSRQYMDKSFDNSTQTTLEFVNETQTKSNQNETIETEQITNSTTHRPIGNQTEEIYNEHYSTVIRTTERTTNPDFATKWSRPTTPMPKREALNNITYLPKNCDDPNCRDIASQILYKMNRDEDPCEDFYQYACGGQTERVDARKEALRRIEREMFKQGTGQKSLEVFRVMYDSCLDYHSRFDYMERVEHGREIVHSLGKLANSQFSPSVQNITELLKGLLRRGSSSLLDVSMDADRHEKKFIFKISIGKNKPFLRNEDELVITRRQMHCMNMVRPELTSDKGEDMDKIYLKYLKCSLDDGDYLRDVENALTAMKLTDEPDVIVASVKKFLNILKKVYTRPNDTRHDHVAKNYSVKKVLEMMFISRKVNWTDLLHDLSGNTIDAEQILHIYDENQMRILFKALNSFSNWELHNALVAMYAEDVYTNLVISYRPTDSEEYCLQQTVDLLKDVSSHYYLSSWSSKYIKAAQSILQMAFAELKKKLHDSLNENTWIQPISREMFTKKLKKMQYMRNSGMDAWLNLELLQQRLADVTLDVTNYQRNVVQLVQRNRIIAYGMLGKYATETQYLWWYYVRPYDTKPVAIYALNAVVAPLGLVMNLPEKLPNYVQLARVSFAIATEMGHHFDPVGIEYEIKMDDISKASYAYLETCPFDKAEYHSEDNINGFLHKFATYPKLSLNEKIARDTAMKLVSGVLNNMMFDTSLPWITDLHDQKQTFYLSLVQEYCEHISPGEYMRRLYESEKVPNSLMVRSFLENSEDFSQAFHCKEGTKMIHLNRCEQFPYLLDDSSY